MDMDRFHRFFPDADEPSLPIDVYEKLVDKHDEDTAFEILCNYEEGRCSMQDIENDLNSWDRY